VEILNKPTPGLKNIHSKMDFFQQAIENLHTEKSVHTTLVFLKRLLLTFPLDSSFLSQSTQKNTAPVTTRERVVYYLKEEKIFDLIIQNAA
jgi:hypothetical protein